MDEWLTIMHFQDNLFITKTTFQLKCQLNDFWRYASQLNYTAVVCCMCERAIERVNECTYVRVGGIECHMWTHSKLNWWILLFLTEQLEANSYGFEKKRRNTLNNLNWTCLLAGHPYRLIYLAGGLPSHFHPYISRSKFMWTDWQTDWHSSLAVFNDHQAVFKHFIHKYTSKAIVCARFPSFHFYPQSPPVIVVVFGLFFFSLYTTSTALSSSFLALQCGWMVGMKEATRRYASLYVFVSFQF